MNSDSSFPIQLNMIPEFSKCSPQSLARLVPNVTVHHLEAGETLYKAGDDANNMFLLIKGHVQLNLRENSRRSNDVIEEDSSIQINSIFIGEEAAVQANQYSNTAVMLSPSTLLGFNKEGLSRLIKETPSLQHIFYESLINHVTAAHPFTSTPPAKTEEHQDNYFSGIGWLLAIIIPLLVYYFSSKPEAGLTSNMASYFAVFSAAVVMWIFRLVEEFIPAVFIVVSVIILGLAPSNVILEGYASGSFFMALSVFGIGAVLLQSGLTYRVSLLILRYTPDSGFWHIFSMFTLGLLLTPILPTANGRTTLIAPLLKDVISLLKYKSEGVAATRMASAAFMGVSLLSAGFLTSKSVNFALFGLFPQQVKDQFTWGFWVYASGIAMLVLLVGYFLHSAVFFRTKEKGNLAKTQITEQLNLLGKMQITEWVSMLGIILFLCGVLSASIHKIQPPWIGLAILYLMLTLGCLSKKQLRTNVDWPFLLMLGGFVGMVKTMEFLAIDTWIAHKLIWVGGFMLNDFNLFILILGMVIYIIRLVVPNNAAIILVAAIFMPIAIAQGINPWVIAFIVLIFSDGWVLPYQCSYYMQLLNLADKEKVFSKKMMLKFNIQSNLLRFLAVYASVPYWKHLGLL